MKQKSFKRYLIATNDMDKFFGKGQVYWSSYMTLKYYLRKTSSTGKTAEEFNAGEDIYEQDLAGARTFKTEVGAQRFINRCIVHSKESKNYASGKLAKSLIPIEVTVKPDEPSIVAFDNMKIGRFKERKGKTIATACTRCGLILKGIEYIRIHKSLSSINLCPFCLVELAQKGQTMLDSRGQEWTEAVNKERFINQLIKS